MTLNIAKGLQLPDEAVTQTFAILAKRGAGKTYTARIFSEEMLKAGAQVLVIDPIGVWWGLRTSADGKKEGLQIIIAGGEHGDIPLQPDSGEIVANLAIDNKISLVIDLSLFRKSEQHRFMADFAETIYRRNRTAVHMIVDEADAFAPQRVQPGEARMLGAMEDLVRRGRARGIGMTMISQRPAVLNKNVLTQIEVLIVLRLTSPQDRAAIGEWVKMNADQDQASVMLNSLQGLAIGTGWFWSPGWLGGLFQQVQVRKSETLDTSNTPKVGGKKVEARKMADVDLGKLTAQLQASISAADENDPKKLRAKIRELEKALEQPLDKEPDTIVTQVEVLPAKLKDNLQEMHHQAIKLIEMTTGLLEYAANFSNASDTDSQFSEIDSRRPSKMPIVAPIKHQGTVIGMDPAQPGGDKSVVTTNMSVGDRKVLIAIAQSARGATRTQLTLLTGYKRSTRDRYLQRLVSAGLAEMVDGRIAATSTGIEALGADYEPLPTGQALIDHLLNTLPNGEKNIFDALLRAKRPVSRQEITDATGYARSTRDRYLQQMVAREIIEISDQSIRVSDSLKEG